MKKVLGYLSEISKEIDRGRDEAGINIVLFSYI
jgi:hypothetical protein